MMMKMTLSSPAMAPWLLKRRPEVLQISSKSKTNPVLKQLEEMVLLDGSWLSLVEFSSQPPTSLLSI